MIIFGNIIHLFKVILHLILNLLNGFKWCLNQLHPPPNYSHLNIIISHLEIALLHFLEIEDILHSYNLVILNLLPPAQDNYFLKNLPLIYKNSNHLLIELNKEKIIKHFLISYMIVYNYQVYVRIYTYLYYIFRC